MITLESEAVWMPLPCEAPLQKKEGGSAPHAALPHQDEPAAASTAQLPMQWFRDYFDTLWRIALRLGVPSHSVDDVVQDTFITASRRRAEIRAGQERRFLIGTVVRVSSNYRQRASVRRELAQTELIEQSEGALPDAEELLIEKRARCDLDEALASLSEAHRSVFVLYELEGFGVREIGELLGIPGGTVASRLSRARAQFSRSVERLQRLEVAQGLPFPRGSR